MLLGARAACVQLCAVMPLPSAVSVPYMLPAHSRAAAEPRLLPLAVLPCWVQVAWQRLRQFMEDDVAVEGAVVGTNRGEWAAMPTGRLNGRQQWAPCCRGARCIHKP